MRYSTISVCIATNEFDIEQEIFMPNIKGSIFCYPHSIFNIRRKVVFVQSTKYIWISITHYSMAWMLVIKSYWLQYCTQWAPMLVCVWFMQLPKDEFLFIYNMYAVHSSTDRPFDLFTHWVWNKVVVVGNRVLVCTSLGWKSLKKRNDKQRACFAFHIIWIEGIQHRLHSCSTLAIQWMENSNKNIESK